MWTIHTVRDVNSDPRYESHFSGYGLGWRLTDVKGNLSVAHTGGLPGMLSIVTMIPDQKLGIVILTNTENGGDGVLLSVSQTIIDRYLGLSNLDWIEKYSKDFKSQQNTVDEVTKKVWETVAYVKNIPVIRDDFICIYKDKWFGEIEVFF